jgi:hypothetical protein
MQIASESDHHVASKWKAVRMSNTALMFFEAARIQGFLTAGGRLRDLAGGSALIEQIGEAGSDGMLGQAASAIGMDVAEPHEDSDVPDGRLILLRNSGGAVHALAPDEAGARRLLEELSLRVLERAPGLEVLGTVVPMEEISPEGFREAWSRAREVLSEQKQSARAPISFAPPFLARCVATGGVAVGKVKDQRLAANPLTPRRNAEDANARLRKALGMDDFEFPMDTDDLSSDEGGYLSVIHLDGNNIGRLLRGLGDGAQSMSDLLGRNRRASTNLAGLSETPVKKAIKWICGHVIEVDSIVEVRLESGRWRTPIKSSGSNMLPLRPLVMGGDDLTIICEGRIALPFVRQLLTQFEECSKETAKALGQADGKPLYACAGVAIVKKSYPFAKAYELAEELMKEAKKAARKQAGSYIDFEVVTASQHSSPEQARGTPGVGKSKQGGHGLTRRPYSLADFGKLLEDAWAVHNRLPRRQVRAIADAATVSREAADNALSHLDSQLDRNLSGLSNPMTRDELKNLLHRWGCEDGSVFSDDGTVWLDLIEVSRFFGKHEDTGETKMEQVKSEVTGGQG